MSTPQPLHLAPMPRLARGLRRVPLRSTLSLACACAMVPAGAQTATAPTTPATAAEAQRITVTARKRDEQMIEVPISIQAFSEKSLREAAVGSVADLTRQSGFTFDTTQGNGATGRANGMLTFRGLQGEIGLQFENSGAIFVDGIFISGGIGSINMADVARVEVLKGPQNVYFGRSTFGGAVNFVTRNPGQALRGVVNATLNNRGSSDVDATVEGALLPQVLSGRVTVVNHNQAAWYRATDGGALGEEGSKSVSGTLYFTPNDKLWVRLRGHYQKDDDSHSVSGYIPAGNNTSCTGKFYQGTGRDGAPVSFTPGTPYFCGSIPKLGDVGTGIFDVNTAMPASVRAAFIDNSLNDPFLSKTPKLDHAGMRRDVTRASLQAGYALPYEMDLAVNVGYNEALTTTIFDLDRSKTQNIYSLISMPTRDLTVDARLSTDQSAALRGVVGLSAFRSTNQNSQIDLISAFGATAPAINSNYINQKANVPAVYGAVEYDFTPQITGSVEARYQRDKISSYTRAGAVIENESKNWLPRFTLRYRPTADLTTYINVSRGVQPLFTNAGYTNASPAGKALIAAAVPGSTDFTPQPKLDSLEIGVKQRLSNNLQYAVAAYSQKWTNRLTNTFIFNPPECGTTTGTTQCPFSAAGAGVFGGNTAKIRGIELSLDAQFTPQWSGGAYIDYKSAKWSSYDATNNSVYGSNRALALTGAAVSFDGNKLGRIPDLTVTANSTYRWALTGAWGAYLRGDLSYGGKKWESDLNFTQTDAYSRLDLRLGFEKAETSVELFVKNVFNNESWTAVNRAADLSLSPLLNFSRQGLFVTAQDPRTYGLRMRYVF